jgi:RHS repeat-associated protein
MPRAVIARIFSALLLVLGLPLASQSYETSFGEQKYDRAKTPATFHGGVEVDAPTGSVTYSIPIGSGIGMRGVTYRPTLSGRWAPQVDYSKYNDPSTSQTNYSASLTTSWATLYPGRLDLRIDARATSKLQTNFEVGSVSGAASGVVPTDANGATLPNILGTGGILGAFGYNITDPNFSVALGPWGTSNTGTILGTQAPMVWMTSGGGLLIGLQDATHPVMSAVADAGCGIGTTYTWPTWAVMVQGDVAYEFVWDRYLYIPTTTRGCNPGDIASINLLNGRFRLNRILNRFGEQMTFTYSASGYTAGWMQNGVAAGPSISVQNTNGTLSIAYAGLASNNPTYTLTQASLGITPPSSEDAWHTLVPQAVTQNQTQESVSFTYATASYPQVVWPSSGSPVQIPVINGISFPNRAMAFTWVPYAYARNRSAYSGWGGYYPSSDWSYTFGVSKVVDTADSQSRTTTHARTLPQLTNSATPYYSWTLPWASTDFYDVITHPDGSSTFYRFASPTTTPDATGAFGSTSMPTADQLQTMLFLKHQVVEERHYAIGQAWSGDLATPAETSTAVTRVRRSAWVLNRVGNPTGLFTQGSVAYPTVTESWRNDEGTTVYKNEALSNWDGTKYGWLTSTASYSLNGASQITRLTQRDYSSDPVRWFMGRKLREQKTSQTDATGNLAAGAVMPLTLPPSIQAFNAELNTLQSAQVGESGGPSVSTQFTYGTSGLNRALMQSVVLTGPYAQSGQVGVDAYGYTSGGNGIPAGVMNLIQQKGAPWPQTYAPTQAVDAFGRPTQQTDPNGISVSYTYDGAGRLSTLSRPNEDTTTISYDDTTHRGARVTRGSEVTEYRYNGFGEPVQERRFDGTAWSNRMTGYDVMGRKIAETVWGSGLGDETKWTSPNLAVSTTSTTTITTTKCIKKSIDTGDCLQWSTYTTTKTTTTPALYGSGQANTQGGTTYAYDSRGRLVTVTSPNMETVTTIYNGLITQKTIQARVNGSATATAQTTSFTKDVLGRLVSVVDAKGQTTAYRYDAADRVLEVRQADPANGLQQLRSWVYDSLGHVVILDQPESGVTYYTSFTVTGKPQITVYGLPRGWRPGSGLLDSIDSTALTTSGARVVRSAFDALGRVQSVLADDGSVNQSFSYDAGGRPALAYGKVTSDSDGGPSGVQRAYSYAKLNGRLSQLDTFILGQATPYTQTFDYNSAGLRTLATDPMGSVTTLFANPATHLPTGITRSVGGTTTTALSNVTYDSVTWNPMSMTFGNGASSAFSYRADQVGMASLSHYESGSGAPKVSWAYQYDESGHLLTDGEDTYQYDELGRLTQVVAERLDQTTSLGSTTQKVTQAFSYDAFGNQLSSLATGALPTGSNLNNFTFNASERAQMATSNQLPATANGIPTGAQYDAQGNLVRMFLQTASSAPSLYMTYDALGRVTQLKDANRNITEAYLYNASGLRTVVNVFNGISGTLTLQKTKVNVYNDVHQLVAAGEQLPAAALVWKSEMVYLGTKEVAEFDAIGMHVTHVDHLGSPRMVTNAAGKLESAQKYLPFGETLDQIGAISTRKGFTNHEQTDPSGLIYMQARFYAPQFHRFLSPDPARDQHFEETQSWNIYSYVQNMPVMKTDPTGMMAEGPNRGGVDTPSYTDSALATDDGMNTANMATINMNAPELNEAISTQAVEEKAKAAKAERGDGQSTNVASEKQSLTLQEKPPATVTISILFDTTTINGHMAIQTPDRIVGYNPDLSNSPIPPGGLLQRGVLGAQWVIPTNAIVPGVVKNEHRSEFNYSLSFNITKAQYAALNKSINANLKGNYNVQNTGAPNCAGWTLAILKDAGIPLGTRTSSGAIREIPYNTPRLTPGVVWHDWLGQPW